MMTSIEAFKSVASALMIPVLSKLQLFALKETKMASLYDLSSLPRRRIAAGHTQRP